MRLKRLVLLALPPGWRSWMRRRMIKIHRGGAPLRPEFVDRVTSLGVLRCPIRLGRLLLVVGVIMDLSAHGRIGWCILRRSVLDWRVRRVLQGLIQ